MAGAEPRLALSHCSPFGPRKSGGSVMPAPVDAHTYAGTIGADLNPSTCNARNAIQIVSSNRQLAEMTNTLGLKRTAKATR